MDIKVKDIKELLNLYNDDEVLKFENLTAIYVTIKKDILKDINKSSSGDIVDIIEAQLPTVPLNIPSEVNLSDIQEFLNTAKSVYSKTKRVSDGIPYGMLKHGVDFTLDDKLFKHYLAVCNNLESARTLKIKMYKEILNANETYWKNI